MTIAACYVSPEGVVLGADSTAAFSDHHFYNHAQKIFEVGQTKSTLGIVIWGLGSLPMLSHRSLISQFAESNQAQPTGSIQEVAMRFGQTFWPHYQAQMAPAIMRFHQLAVQPTLTPEEQKERDNLLQNLSGGFCLGGTLKNNPAPEAFSIMYGPTVPTPIVQTVQMGIPMFWGQPNLLQRLFAGLDEELFKDILRSGRWTGTPQELLVLVNQRRLSIPGILPIREAIDFIHSSLYATIKAMKFSQLAPVCGGPVEIAVVTTDRPFRWVRHKRMETAITPG